MNIHQCTHILSEGKRFKSTAISKVIDWVEHMNGKLGIPERLRDILKIHNNTTDKYIDGKYHPINHNDGILVEDEIVDMSLKADRNNTGFTNFIRFSHNDYERVLRECV